MVTAIGLCLLLLLSRFDQPVASRLLRARGKVRVSPRVPYSTMIRQPPFHPSIQPFSVMCPHVEALSQISFDIRYNRRGLRSIGIRSW
jgi:hypothetical protein